MKKLILIPLLVAGCATNPYKVKPVDSTVDSSHGSVGNESIAVDKDKQAVVQKETSAQEELREQVWANRDLEQKIETNFGQFRRCQAETADPRLGGTGKVADAPDLGITLEPSKQKEEFGTGDGELKFVKREMYLDRLNAEKKHNASLRSALTAIEKHRGTCERELGYARVKAGLPAERFKGEGSFAANGRYVRTVEEEQNLDDAFSRLAAQKEELRSPASGGASKEENLEEGESD